MMRNHVDQDLRCRADSLPLSLRFIDQRFGFSVQILRLFDDRSCSMEKIDQRLGRWQGFLNLLKLCVAKAGNMADELDEPVFEHLLTSLVPSQLIITSGRTRCSYCLTNLWWPAQLTAAPLQLPVVRADAFFEDLAYAPKKGEWSAYGGGRQRGMADADRVLCTRPPYLMASNVRAEIDYH